MTSGGGGGLQPGATYTVKLGSTWDQIPTDLIHAVQYDFKPASIDPSQPGQMRPEPGSNGVTVLLPHKDTDESSEFKGNKQQTPKDCFLIVDKATKTIYLQKVSNMIRVKKHRSVKKKLAVRREEGERASPVPNSLQGKESTPSVTSKDRASPVPSTLTSTSRQSPVTSQTRDTDSHKPPSPKPQPESVKSENTDSEPKAKRLKPSAAIASSGNLSSESSGSDSDSSNESSDSDNEKSFLPVKEEGQLDIGGGGMLITPLGEPDVKEESGDAIMNMLSQDLDISSDSDSD